MTCEHRNFRVDATVNRLEDIGRFNIDIRVTCEDCNTPFRFIGLPCGIDLNGAAVSANAEEARLAIAPRGQVLSELEGTPIGFTIRKGK
jgi:hypothetical protein